MRLLVLSYKLAGTDSARKRRDVCRAVAACNGCIPAAVLPHGTWRCSLASIRFRATGQGRFRMLPPLVAEMSVCVGLP